LKLSNLASRYAPALVLDTADRNHPVAVVAVAVELDRHEAVKVALAAAADDDEPGSIDDDRRHILALVVAVLDDSEL